MIQLDELTGYLDGFLRIGDVPDEPGAVNGLQVANASGSVRQIVAAVDASLATIEGVIAGGRAEGTMLLVHHGMLWDGNVPVTGRRFRRLAALLRHDIALYSAHIPLDVHPEVGNNVMLAHRLGCTDLVAFDSYKGAPLGVQGRLAGGAVARRELADRLDAALATTTRLIPGGPERVETVAIITGGAGGRVGAAGAAGVDAFVTGEGAHYTYFDAMELGVNVYFAGHYATETLGVQALATHLAARFGLPWAFHDHPTGL
ncbi:MAG: Nif3-like dinuclear metal center hexameric protein [Gemmatimonadetes bacterium]|nr:Nif3-like dinuclear metal center hexameric protein [Gemmatimonadota bacterium]